MIDVLFRDVGVMLGLCCVGRRWDVVVVKGFSLVGFYMFIVFFMVNFLLVFGLLGLVFSFFRRIG